MATPAHKTEAYIEELLDWSRPVSRSRIEWIVADCKRMLKADAANPAPVHATLGLTHIHLGQPAEALHHFRNAMHYDSTNPSYKLSAAAALTDLGRPQEALDLLAETDGASGFLKVLVLGNAAEALSQLGMLDEAREVLAEALRIGNPADPGTILVLANQASAIGSNREAIELFARYIRLTQRRPRGNDHPLQVILSASDELKRPLELPMARPLARAIASALSFGQALFDAVPPPRRTLSAEELAEADAQAEAVYHETLPARRRATEEAMAEDHRAS